ncbi:hypothetical protein FB45DRAFT_997452 [Roridomyces roridus]|uniref:Ribosomal protein/NADH dehydrogenase domain-containing protein n=1 Tax=Roridomyces roridus TaxID=1738132 RepID=A0AAD7FYZ6_9AGAR|nr:hypothetical protein FB45DRAFT_997452 [Roridomyces roridus]
MVRAKPAGPSPLAQLVTHLRAPPRLTLPHITSLRLTLAARNDHFGARHFLKEQLPRIRFANPNLDIHVRKFSKRPKDEWRPELQVSFDDGKTQTLNLHGKWSTAILRELMDSSGSPSWARWKAEVARTGVPLVAGIEKEPELTGEESPEPRYSLAEWRQKHPRRVRRQREDSKSNDAPAKQRQKASAPAQPVQETVDPERIKEENAKKKAAKKEARRAKLDAPRLAEEEAERRVALELLSKPSTGAAAILP